MDFNPVMWALCRDGGGSGGGSGGSGDNFPIGDGNTHLWISLAEGRTSPTFGAVVKGTVTVDWGDGSEADALFGQGNYVHTPIHEYSKAGNYVITVTADEDSTLSFYGNTANGTYMLADNGDYGGAGSAYRSAVRKIELGKAVREYNSGGFCLLYALSDIVFSDNFTDDYVQGFTGCASLQTITLPSATSIIAGGAFDACVGLTKMIFPANVSEVGYRAFRKCSGVIVFDFSKNTSVPTLSATNAFDGISTDCIFEIPASLYDEWVAATNWSAIAATNTFVGV